MPRKAKEKIIDEDLQNEVLDTAKPSKVKVSKKTTKKSDSDTSSKTESIKLSEKKSSAKETTSKTTKKSETKATDKKTTQKKSGTKATDKKTAQKKSGTKTSTRKTTTKKIVKDETVNTPISIEYYDLPYKYNKTVIKLLAKNPTTLFVYWEISDEDITSFKEKYGENFLYITKPVLVIHNLTDGYSYEIDVNDFANNWYIDVNDTKCEYVVELIRKPLEYTEKIPEEKLHITSSNTIESPNDHILFFNENDTIYFKNINTNKYTERVVKPFFKNVLGIYENLSISLDSNNFDFKNPSSHM